MLNAKSQKLKVKTKGDSGIKTVLKAARQSSPSGSLTIASIASIRVLRLILGPITAKAVVTASLFGVSTQFAVAQQADIEQALSIGGYFARGDYGEAVDTEIKYVPVTYEWNAGEWGLQFTAPYLQVTGLGNVLVNVGGVTQAVAGAEVTTSSGPGDAIASLIYRVPPWAESVPFVDLRLDVKLPTADETKGMGTGEIDASVQVDLSQDFSGIVGFATLGYTWRGETTLFPGLADAAFAQVGLAVPINNRVNIGAYYDYREAASQFSAESHELLPYVNWQLSEQWSVTGLLSTGFTQASADFGALAQLRYSW